ncbi:MAG: hypothetical protein K6G22_00785 [Lachnospiraceae bacterium]|nr:hypothetical protein [Lachnospiraceae bacterium]
MPEFVVRPEVRCQSIEWMNLKPEYYEVVKKTGVKTIEELIPLIDDLPIDTARRVKAKILFNIEY